MEALAKAQQSATSMRDLAEQLEERLGSSWLRVVRWLREGNRLADVQRAIERNDFDGAIQGITDAAKAFASDVTSAQTISARVAADWLGNETDRLISFNEQNRNAVDAVARTRTDLITLITADQRESVQGAIREGLERGDNPRVIARDARMAVGLTPSQRQIVSNMRNELEAGRFAAAASRELIDGNTERTLRRMQRDGGELSAAQVDTFVERYADNMATWRSTTIARTEGLRAAHMGHATMFQQAVDDGIVQAGELVQRWNHKRKGRHWRKDHAAMHGQERPFGEPFVSGSGVHLMFPLDPDAPPEETINCHCVVSTRYIRKR